MQEGFSASGKDWWFLSQPVAEEGFTWFMIVLTQKLSHNRLWANPPLKCGIMSPKLTPVTWEGQRNKNIAPARITFHK